MKSLFQKRIDYGYNTPLRRIFADLRKKGIDLDEETILKDYERFDFTEDLANYYYDKWEEIWDNLDSKNGLLNSDVIDAVINRVVDEAYPDDPEMPEEPPFLDSSDFNGDEIESFVGMSRIVFDFLIGLSHKTGSHRLSDFRNESDFMDRIPELWKALALYNQLANDPEIEQTLKEMQKCFPHDGLILDMQEIINEFGSDEEDGFDGDIPLHFRITEELMDYSNQLDKYSLEELENELSAYNLPLTREKVLEDYSRLHNLNQLNSQYLTEFEDSLNDGTGKGQELLFTYTERVVREHCNPAETGDFYFLSDMIDDFEEADYRKIPQEDIETVYRGLIAHARNHGIRRLCDMNGLVFYDDFPMRAIKACHNRNSAFRSLIREFYETFEDADPKMYPAVYKEVKASAKKK